MNDPDRVEEMKAFQSLIDSLTTEALIHKKIKVLQDELLTAREVSVAQLDNFMRLWKGSL